MKASEAWWFTAILYLFWLNGAEGRIDIGEDAPLETDSSGAGILIQGLLADKVELDGFDSRPSDELLERSSLDWMLKLAFEMRRRSFKKEGMSALGALLDPVLRDSCTAILAAN